MQSRIRMYDIGDTTMACMLLKRVEQSHHTPEDFLEGDLTERISAYRLYRLQEVDLSVIRLDQWLEDPERTAGYQVQLSISEPPIPILDDSMTIIDGTHRLNALNNAGRTKVLCWVGIP